MPLLCVMCSLTTDVLQNNPRCQDVEFSFAVRNSGAWRVNARSGSVSTQVGRQPRISTQETSTQQAPKKHPRNTQENRIIRTRIRKESANTKERSVSEVVKLERHDVIGIVTVNNPPVNALSAAVRGGILECMKAAIADPQIKAIVLTCAGRTFIAGADITEFGKPPKPPGLHEVLTEMENSPKPIVAAIHGTALGGGLEVALACHYRVAVKEAKLGLPEVKLGLLPGAGGTQRLPRAVGPELAVKMIVSGDPISAQEALKSGLI